MAHVKRGYDGSGRQEQARARRRKVVAAARELFEQDGYRQTTVAGIAAAAGVSAEMVYKAFGTKAAVAKAVFDTAVAGDDEPVPVAERPEARAIREEPDVRRRIALFVAGLVQRLERSARVQIMVRDGRHVDDSLEPVWAALRGEGLAGMERLGRDLVDTGQLRRGLGLAETRDLLWNYVAIDHYERLVLQQGWARPRFEEWLSGAIISALVDGPAAR